MVKEAKQTRPQSPKHCKDDRFGLRNLVVPNDLEIPTIPDGAWHCSGSAMLSIRLEICDSQIGLLFEWLALLWAHEASMNSRRFCKLRIAHSEHVARMCDN
jgi:hypothetical protein